MWQEAHDLYVSLDASAGTPPGPIVNLIMFALMIIGLVLSLQSRDIRSQ